MVKVLLILMMTSTSVFAADVCEKTTEQFVKETTKMQLDQTYSKFGNEDNSKKFSVIKSNMVARIGKEPPYPVDTFMIFKGIDYKGDEVMTMSVEGSDCHRTFFIIDKKLLDDLLKDNSI